jgi:hypothetical protein
VLGAVVAVACLAVVGWNTASGGAATGRLLHGPVRKEFDAGLVLTNCLDRRVQSLVPAGSTVHLDIPGFPAVVLRLTEVMYPRGYVVPDSQPADYLLYSTISPSPTSCDSLELNLRPLR